MNIRLQRCTYPTKHIMLAIHTNKFGYISLIICKDKAYRSFYISPNNSTWASTFYLGSNKDEKCKAVIRRTLLGHNFSIRDKRDLLSAINNSFVVNADYFLSEYREKNSGTRRY